MDKHLQQEINCGTKNIENMTHRHI